MKIQKLKPITPATRIRRLKQLHKMLLNHDKLFPETAFFMGTWCNNTGYYQKPNGYDCGTAACALGSAALYPPFTKLKQGLYVKPGFGASPEIKNARHHTKGYKLTGFYAGAAFFGITMRQSRGLFSPSRYSYLNESEITPNHVAMKVARLIKYYSQQMEKANA